MPRHPIIDDIGVHGAPVPDLADFDPAAFHEVLNRPHDGAPVAAHEGSGGGWRDDTS